eukprot:gene1108-1409_t
MSDEEVISLSAESLAALNEFLKEKAALEAQDDIKEDWQLSQFWYEPETSETVADTILKETDGKVIICLSTPSIFKVLHKKLDTSESREKQIYLFEYDQRFSVYGEDFCFYDYKHPLEFPKQLIGIADYICLDPPFLSEECLEKVVKTIDSLRNKNTKLLLLTGRIQWPHIQRLLPDMKICKFEPKHPRLQNDFFCCSNYNSEILGLEEK